MSPEARRITAKYAGVSAVVAFVTQPIPALDELIVVPVHYRLCTRLARARGVSRKSLPWRQIRKIIWYGAGARLVGNASLGLVPVVGMFANAITAIALTEFLGQYIDQALASPGAPPPEVTMDGLKKLFANAVARQGKATSAPASTGEAPAAGSAQ